MIFRIIAVLILIVFYGTYLKKFLSQRRRGIQTDSLGRGKTGFVKFIELSLKLVTYIVPVAETVSILADAHLDLVWLRITGAALGAAGAAVFVVSVVTMRDSWRAGVPSGEKTELVTSGIYSYSRNPAFLGFDLVYLGELFMFFNPYLAAVSLCAIILLHLQIVNVEEDYLIAAFGDEYLAYRKRVCRYLGRKG